MTIGFVRILDAKFVEPHQDFDPEEVADLFAVAIDRDLLVSHGGDGHPSNPALIFHSKLAGAIDAALSEHDGGNVIDSTVIPDILISCALGASVRTVEI